MPEREKGEKIETLSPVSFKPSLSHYSVHCGKINATNIALMINQRHVVDPQSIQQRHPSGPVGSAARL